jgi:Protein of unknown function (DUF3987)
MTHPDLTGEPTPSSFSSLLRPALAPSALHGLPGDIVRALAPHTEADPAALLLTFLAMFGCAVGGGPHDRVGSTPHPARLFVLIVGDAATARKGTAGDVIEDLMRRAEPEWHDERIHRGIQSAEALIRLVDDGLSHDRRLMVVESEFGRLLSTLAQRGNLSATIKDAYDGKPLHVTVRNENRSLKATRPHISIVGHVQPGVLVERLPEVELFSGFANRFLFAVVNRSQLLPSGGSVDEAVLDGLADRIHDAVDSAWEFALAQTDPISRQLYEHFGMQPPVELPRTEDFTTRWRGLYGEGNRSGPLNRHEPGILGEFTGRAPTHVLRLAVTYALADQSIVLDVQHLEAAFAVWEYCAASARAIFGSITGDRDVDRVLNALYRAADHSITRADISALFHRNKSKRQLDIICDGLLDTGQVTHRHDSSGPGRPVDVYELTAQALDEKTKEAKKGENPS